MSRSPLVTTGLVALLLLGCSAALPGQSPTGQPTASPTDQPTSSATLAATATPTSDGMPTATPTSGASANPTPCDPYYGDDCGPGRSTPPAGAVSVSAITYGEIGAYLAGSTRMALYTFDNDTAGSSACSPDCAATWPPLTVAMGETPVAAPGVAGELGTIQRADGTYQVTYNGAPLYYYVGDTQLYDVTGDGIGGVWHLARP